MSDFPVTTLPDFSEYTKCKEKDEFEFDDGTSTTLVHAEFYEKDTDGKIVSIGVYSHDGKTLFCAWGYKDDEHCAAHAFMGEDGNWLKPDLGCAMKIPIKKGEENIGIQIPTAKGSRDVIF